MVTLEVRRSNLAARQLYRKFEFEERRLRRHYYGPGEDAIIMELHFDLIFSPANARTSFYQLGNLSFILRLGLQIA